MELLLILLRTSRAAASVPSPMSSLYRTSYRRLLPGQHKALSQQWMGRIHAQAASTHCAVTVEVQGKENISLLKLLSRTTGDLRSSNSMMEAFTCFVAVAVQAMIGALGKSACRLDRVR